MPSRSLVYVALLRGINVGGRTAVSMPELKACFEKLGFSNVQTYINSGNVIFLSKITDARTLETNIEKALAKAFRYEIAVVVRSLEEMEQIINHIPASWFTNEEQKSNVIFLRHSINYPSIIQDLHPKEGVEELYYHPGVLLWSAKTSDLTKSSMIKLSRLGIYKQMTVRNLNTTQKIYSLMQK